MHNRKYLVACVLALPMAFVGLAFLPDACADDDEKIIVPRKIQNAVSKMADEVGKGNKVDKDASAFFKDHEDELKKTMWVFKPRMANGEGGFGLGPKAGVYEKDGIEVLIINKGNPRPRNADQKITKEDLEKHGEDYSRAMDVTIAMADITHQYKPTKKLPGQNPANWPQFADEMKKAALDVKAGIKAKNAAAVKMAFIKLSGSCANCHTIFRDADELIVSEPPFLKAINSMADAVSKGQKIDKDADAFFKKYKGDLKNVKSVFLARSKEGLGVGPKPGTYTPDAIAGYIALQADRGASAMPVIQLKSAANDLNRLADITIVMAEVMQRYKPNNMIFGGATGVAKPAEWTASVDDMKQGALDLKVAVKANKPDDAKLAFRKIYSSCVTCHHAFCD